MSLQPGVWSHFNMFQCWLHNSSGFVLVGEIVTTLGFRFVWYQVAGNAEFQSTALQSTSEASRVLRHGLFVGLQSMFLSEGSYLSGGLGGLLASSFLNYDAVYDCTQHRHRISPTVVIIDFGKVQVIWHVFKGLLWPSSLYACRIPPMPRSHTLNLLVFEGTEREGFSVVVIKALL